MFFFFFSSRRRHTRWPRDWSSDVCSSDLPRVTPGLITHRHVAVIHAAGAPVAHGHVAVVHATSIRGPGIGQGGEDLVRSLRGEIGRAACRESVRTWAVD